MRAILLSAATLTALAAPLAAQDDPIATRQLLMRANGHAAAIAGNIMKGELDYSPVVGRSVISTMLAVSTSFGDYFPEGSLDTERSDAAPAIWEDFDDFMSLLADFHAAAAEAAEASGEDGPADAEAFAAAIRPVMDQCRDCHESYRLDR